MVNVKINILRLHYKIVHINFINILTFVCKNIKIQLKFVIKESAM